MMANPSEPGPIMVTVQWPNPNGGFDDADCVWHAPVSEPGVFATWT